MADDTEYRQVVYRLLPGSREKARRLATLAGACRVVWNAMLDQQEQLVAAARLAGAERLPGDETAQLAAPRLAKAGERNGGRGRPQHPGHDPEREGNRRGTGHRRASDGRSQSRHPRDLRAMLGYKAPRLIAVNPAQTSQTCAECGTADAASRPSQATFKCVACGHADLNAARNIRRRGLAHLHGEGALPSGTPMIRETDHRLAA